ncbi:hypothetical protein QE152_g33674 [Popillia japonica]|uniref:Integrase catalytic domain-containing protein n=1 Tax=Popillia japonica TaxID=7064 RepID=A0AAW1IWA0_POPJA
MELTDLVAVCHILDLNYSGFTAREFQDYCKGQEIEHIMITTGVPRGNGQVERTHRTIIPVLTKLSLEEPQRWYKHIDHVQRAVNCTYHRSINSTPFEVLTGVKMRNKDLRRIYETLDRKLQ